MRKDIWDRFLLRIYYEENLMSKSRYGIPFEFLFDDELQSIYGSLGFAVFKLRYSISVFVEKLAERLKNNKKR